MPRTPPVIAVAVAVAAVACIAGCVPRGPAPALSGSSAARPAAATVPFAPGTADPARKAALLAAAPRLDELFRAKVGEGRATGLAVGIVLDGELVYGRGFGVRDVDTRMPIDLDSMFCIASMTKSFTAAAVMKLRDDGRVVLDAPAATYEPELGALVAPVRDGPGPTVRHLLTHASGLPYDDAWGLETFGVSYDGMTQMIRSGVVMSHAPGVRYVYSNLGYAFLGRIVQRVSGVRFRDYVTAEILRPLGMTATVWQAGDVPLERRAIGYHDFGGRLTREPLPSQDAFDAAGGLWTSMRDYARYVAFQLAAYPPRDAPESGPLRRSTVREMHQGQRWSRWQGEEKPVAGRNADGSLWLDAAAYGFGWLNDTTCLDEGIVQHGGAEPGFWNSVHLFPERGMGIVMLATTEMVGFKSFPSVVALLRETGALPPRRAISAAPAVVQALATMQSLLGRWDQRLFEDRFDPHSLRYFWLADVRGQLAKVTDKHGRCEPDGPIRARDLAGGIQRLKCERGVVDLGVVLTPLVRPRIQNVWWREVPADAAAGDPRATCGR
jgi:CubicO group peptidase (beta-lactamase class C family)